MEQVTIQLAYKPRDVFIPFHQRHQRWAILVCHRRSGKTVAAVNDLVAKALKCRKPNGFFAYIGPFAGQVEQIAWSYLKQAVKDIPGHEVVETKKMVRVPSSHGSKAAIRLFGADNPDALRGLYFDGVILDEYADMKRSIWSEVVRPALADRRGWAVFIGTPKGKNAFYDTYEKAKQDTARWYSLLLKASESGLLPPSELEELRKELDEETYAQEMEVSFSAGIKGAYYANIISKMEDDGRLQPFEVVRSAPVHVVFDLGYTDATAAWFFQLINGELRVVDHHEWTETAIPKIVSDVAENFGYKMGDWWLPHDAKAKSLQTGKSIIEQLWSLGVRPKAVPELDVIDGIAAVRETLPKCRINGATCYQGIEALKNYQKKWNAELGVFSKNPLHDWSSHSADSFRYLALAVRDIDLSASAVKPAQSLTPNEAKTVWEERATVNSVTKVEWRLDELWETAPRSDGFLRI